MRPWTLFLPCLLATTLPGASARRGSGGGSSNDDSQGGGDSSSDSSSPSDDRCGIPDKPPVWKWDLIPRHAQNNTGMKGAGLGYGGSFFHGEASLNYIITAGQRCLTMNDIRSTHMLGYAWIGPQPLYPTGPVNPFIIGFKAWETDLSLDRIGDSYAYIKKDRFCPWKPDLFRVATTHGWTDFDARKTRAADFMNMNFTESGGNREEVLFNATRENALNFEPTDDGLFLSLPRGTCSSTRDYHFQLPDELVMSGSFTNTTLNLTLSGRGNATSSNSRDAGLTAEFNITFTGVFDAANSTHIISLRHDKPLVTWAQNSGSHHRIISWSSSFVYITALLLWG